MVALAIVTSDPDPRAAVLQQIQDVRASNRKALRQFLRITPREERMERQALEALPADGGGSAPIRFNATRAQLTRLIETRLNPRRRLIARLHIEQGLSRAQTCARLRICLKTLERDVTGLLDELQVIAWDEVRSARELADGRRWQS